MKVYIQTESPHLIKYKLIANNMQVEQMMEINYALLLMDVLYELRKSENKSRKQLE